MAKVATKGEIKRMKLEAKEVFDQQGCFLICWAKQLKSLISINLSRLFSMEHILFQCDAFSWYMASLPGFLVQISLEFT